MANVVEFVCIESIQKCSVCKSFHESVKLYSSHKVTLTVTDENEAQGVSNKLNLVPVFLQTTTE